jgi:hypothetical protein
MANPVEIASTVSIARGEDVSSREGIIAKIHQALQPHINEMFFAPTLILVEGLEDVAYITTYLHLMGLWDEYRKYGCHMVHANNKHNLFNPIAIASKLGIPYFVIFDADGDKQNDPNGRGERHRKDNVTILNLCGTESSTPFPTAHVVGDNFAMWASNIGDGVKADIGDTEYTTAKDQAHLVFNGEGDLQKNSLFIAELLTNLWNAGHQSVSLKRVCEAIISFARPPRAQLEAPTVQSPATSLEQVLVAVEA